MNRRLGTAFASAAVVLLTATAARADSAYSNVVMNLNPVAYWPLQETAQPPMADVQTNLGSLGPIANAYYASTNAVRGVPGAIAGDNNPAVNFIGGNGGFAMVPTTDHRVSLQPGQPFTVECWTRASSGQSYRGIIAQTGPNNAGGLNGVNNSFGWSLNIGFSPYRGTGSQNSPLAWTFHVFNGNGFTGGAEAEAANNTGWLTGGSIDYVNSWVYLAGVFDGTNCLLYAYSTNLDNATWGGTNLMNVGGQAIPLAQLPITTAPGAPVGGPGTDIPGAAFAPDTWDPLTIGITRSLTSANEFLGAIDEVAIYTNALTSAQIASHFIAGTNGLGNYSTTILADQPYMYWRMDAPTYTWPTASTFPPAANYGSLGASVTNFNTLGTSAVYQPGTVPGVAGPTYPGFGDLSKACAFNGLSGAVDAGYNAAFDPVGIANNFTLVAWFQGNPMDAGGRWVCLASHSNGSWKSQFNNGTTYGYKGVGGQVSIAPATYNVNDGNWHMYALTSTYTNGVCTNLTLLLDGGSITTLANTGATPGKPTMDAFIGGAPDYSQPTNGTFNTGQQYFAGRIAHVAYFDYALSSAQLQSLYFTANPTSLPVIAQQPVSATAYFEVPFTNSVVAVSPVSPLSYQWYKDGAPLAGQTSASLIFNPVRSTDASTNYFVVVTNIYGAVTSAVANVTVRSGVPQLTGQLPITYTNRITLYGGSSPATLGSSPTFAVSVSSPAPVGYQWWTNGVAVVGATRATFSLTNCQMSSPTSFQCVVTNIYGTTNATWSVAYVPAATAPFPQAVLADRPLGYWRLNEPDDQLGDYNVGVVCKDYQAANNGLYTNVTLGQVGYNSLSDPTETAAYFGWPQPSIVSWIGNNVDFSLPAGGNGAFSVAVWANGTGVAQIGNAGLVTKGAWGAEQFTLDEGAANASVRFTVRNASGANYYSANSSVQLGADSAWHFVVGVCDGPHGQVLLYVDGKLTGTAALPAGSGILSSTEPLTIGARKANGGAYGNQFWGDLNDVAVYNYALSSNQIVRQYLASGVGPFMTQQPPANTNVGYGGTLAVAAAASGTAPLSYRWFDVNANAYLNGQTSATLVLNNVTSPDSYYVTVTNAYGSVDSTWVSVNVISGAPQVYTGVKNPFYGFTGQTAVNSVEAYGTMPLNYQWQFYNGTTWVNLADNGRISGSHSNLLTIANLSAADAGNYQVIISNGSGPVTSGPATLAVFGLPMTFNGGGGGWTANGSALINNDLLTLTDPSVGGQGSFFFQFPQYIGAFQAAFTYQASGNKAADGVTFCLQNDPRGPAALGGGGSALGVGGGTLSISPSAELEMNIYGTAGYAFATNGLIPSSYAAPGTVNFKSGNPIRVTVTYVSGRAALSFTEGTTSYRTNLAVGDLTKVLGAETAYVGFTGAYGGTNAIQTITDFSFTSMPSQNIQIVGPNAVITWPGSVTGFVLQRNSDLTKATWVDVTSPDNLVNGQHQVVDPLGPTSQFYRLLFKP